MNRKSTPSMGALHPVLFIFFVYIISFVLAFFVCRVVYYSINDSTAKAPVQVERLDALTVAR